MARSDGRARRTGVALADLMIALLMFSMMMALVVPTLARATTFTRKRVDRTAQLRGANAARSRMQIDLAATDTVRANGGSVELRTVSADGAKRVVSYECQQGFVARTTEGRTDRVASPGGATRLTVTAAGAVTLENPDNPAAMPLQLAHHHGAGAPRGRYLSVLAPPFRLEEVQSGPSK